MGSFFASAGRGLLWLWFGFVAAMIVLSLGLVRAFDMSNAAAPWHIALWVLLGLMALLAFPPLVHWVHRTRFGEEKKARRKLITTSLFVAPFAFAAWAGSLPAPPESRADVRGAVGTSTVVTAPLPEQGEQPASGAAVSEVAETSLQSTSKVMPFDQCLQTIDGVSAQYGAEPNVIVDTAVMKMVRFTTTDGSVLVTCSAPDRKMIMTRSPYGG